MTCNIDFLQEDKCIDFVNLENIILEVCNDGNIIREILYAALRTTKTYKTCIETYDRYLNNYIKFLNSIEIKDSDMVALLYRKMLLDGYLTYNKNIKYDKSYGKLYRKLNISSIMDLDELEGCYVATGLYICRHISSFLTDLESRAGYEVSNMYVATYKQKKHKKGIADIKIFPDGVISNHQITLLNNNNAYGFCPTSGLFIEFNDYVTNKYNSTDNIIVGRSKDSNDCKENDFYYYMSLNDYITIAADNNDKIINLFNNAKFKSINIEELYEKNLLVNELYRKRKSEIEIFYEDTKEDLSLIANSMNTMVPKKNIKSLKIK